MTEEKSRLESQDCDVASAAGERLDARSFRTRVAVLWVAVAVALSGAMVLYVYVPGAVEEMLAGKAEGEPLTTAVGFGLAGFVIIPLLMAAVTLLVGDRVNRYLNLIIALAYTLYGFYVVTNEVLGGHFDGHILMAAVACVLGLLIAALAFIELRKSAGRPSLRT